MPQWLTKINDASCPELEKILVSGRETISEFAAALLQLGDRLDTSFAEAAQCLLTTRGHVIVSGVGKSGLIGRKIAATLASTGTPSFFVHATEAFHGDLGMFTQGDVAILISYSGETEEVVRLVPCLKRFHMPTIALVGRPLSTLGRRCDIVLDIGIEREACPNNLAPTTSTLATLAIGDALAIALMRQRKFGARDFARFHPGGSLGRALLTQAAEEMVGAAASLVVAEKKTA